MGILDRLVKDQERQVKVQISLPQSVLREIDEVATHLNTPKSAVIRECFFAGFRRLKTELKRKSHPSRADTVSPGEAD